LKEEFERKNYTTLVFLLSSCSQVLKSFMTDVLNIIVDDVGTWFLGWRVELCVLHMDIIYQELCDY